MLNYRLNACAIAALLTLLTAPAQAAELGRYRFESESLAAEAIAPGVSFTTVRTGAGLAKPSFVAGKSSGKAYGASDWSLVEAADEYFEFGMVPEASKLVTLEQITFDQDKSATGPAQWVLRSSLDDFATVLGTGATHASWGSTQVVNLPSLFAALEVGVQFRLYGYGATQKVGTWRVDNISVWGSVASEAVASEPALSEPVWAEPLELASQSFAAPDVAQSQPVPGPIMLPGLVLFGFGIGLKRSKRQ
jgi:hypothetical protein